jgi:DNA-binding MarR family transcriptional regulator
LTTNSIYRIRSTLMTVQRITTPMRLVFLAFSMDPDAELYGALLTQRTGLAPGTVYPLLRRMREEGWLTYTEEPQIMRKFGRPPRKNYRLTESGRKKMREVTSMPLFDN